LTQQQIKESIFEAMKISKFIALLFLPLVLLTSANTVSTDKIEWLTLEQAQEKMKTAPKKLFVDLYTDWCGWCKVMDRNSFSHPVNIELMNKYFYAVKFNAEKGDSLNFNGKSYRLLPRGGRPLHEWAKKFGSSETGLSYPTTIYFTENLSKIQTIPGYLDPQTLEKVLEFIGGDYGLRGISWPEFEESYIPKIPAETGE